MSPSLALVAALLGYAAVALLASALASRAFGRTAAARQTITRAVFVALLAALGAVVLLRA